MYNGEGQDGAAFVMGLIDPIELHATYDDARSGCEDAWSGGEAAQAAQCRADDGADAGQSRPDETENSAGLSSVRAEAPQNGAQTRIMGAQYLVTSYTQPMARGR